MTVDHRIDWFPFIVAHVYPTQKHGITKYFLTHRNSYRWPATECYEGVGLRQEVPRIRLEADGDSSEGYRLRSPRVREAQANRVPPQIGFYNHAQRLIVRSFCSRIGKGEVN